jgi:hypothetical protein
MELKLNIRARTNFPTSTQSKTHNFRRENFPLLCSLLSEVDWSPIYQLHDVNEVCAAFYEKLYFVFDESVPCYVHNDGLDHRWYSKKLKGNIRSKERCYKKYKRFRIESDYREYMRLRRLVTITAISILSKTHCRRTQKGSGHMYTRERVKPGFHQK